MAKFSLPIKFDSTSNGEFIPPVLSQREQRINELACGEIEKHSKKLNAKRRDFIKTTSAAAVTLLAANQVNAKEGLTGGFYSLSTESGVEPSLANEVLMGSEFIFDIQGHFVDPNGRWLQNMPEAATPFYGFGDRACVEAKGRPDRAYLQCIGPDQFIKDVFEDSETDLMVLSFVPSKRESEPLTIEEAAATRDIVEKLDGAHRLLLHGRVNPNQDGDLQGMDELAENWKVSAWKTYTQWGPDGTGFFMHDAPGIAMIEKARSLGVKNICIHKGFPFGPNSYQHSTCQDIGIVAKAYPDINFIIYHSGYDNAVHESEYAESNVKAGINSLVHSLQKNDIPANANVFAELGSTWRYLMRHPEQAAHVLGKLIKYVGDKNVLWGTDSIWYGSPQDQIQAFRSFQISEEFQDKFGYSALTPALKAQIFGLNAAVPYKVDLSSLSHKFKNDATAQNQLNAKNNPTPHFQTYGPKNRREFLNLMRWQEG